MSVAGSASSLVASGAGAVGLAIRPTPVVVPGTILIRPVRVGLCGTDLEIIAGTIDPDFITYPVVLGHEWSGVVEEIAPDVTTDLSVGDLVVVEGVIPCGHCARCREGATNLCETSYDEIGFTRDGAVGPHVLAPHELVHRIDPAVGADAAALVEPASVVYRALRRVSPAPAAKVLVIGAGTIGLLATQLVSLWSPAVITVLDRRAEQGDLAARAGATEYVVSAEALATDYDIVIDAAGAVATVLIAIDHAKRGGTIVLLGYPGDGVTAPIVIDNVINNDLTLIGSFAYTSSIWREVVNLLNTGRLNLDFLVTHRFALENWPLAIDALRNTEGTRAKVMLDLDAQGA
jgi:2-desacetyl-2-hydroxyethyl bacteriochlorophyllide A dehydrogenase